MCEKMLLVMVYTSTSLVLLLLLVPHEYRICVEHDLEFETEFRRR